MKLGFIGLGKMGSRMATKLLLDQHELVVWNRSQEAILNFKYQISNIKYDAKNLKVSETIEKLVQSLDKPRVVWSMLPAGDPTESVLLEVSKYVEQGDIVIDGGNAHFKDTEKRSEMFSKKGTRFLGIGVSGGIVAVKQGYPLMVGGDVSAYQYIKTILDSLANPHGGHEYFGAGGAGHFVKMIHNGIEYGIMQSLGEGFGVLDKSSYHFDLLKVTKLYQKGTLVSGFMLDRALEVLEKDPKLESITGVIGKASGETVWAVEEAKKQQVPIEIIERSLEFRNESQTNSKIQNSFAAKMVAALRNAFGGHDIKKR